MSEGDGASTPRAKRGRAQPPPWFARVRALRPAWTFEPPAGLNSLPHSERAAEFDRLRAEFEAGFKAFILMELERRLWAETDAAAADLQGASLSLRAALLDDLIASGWRPLPPSRRSRGRPAVDPVEREFHPTEEAARGAAIIRDIFEDYWGKRNRPYSPTAEQMAADFFGVDERLIRQRVTRGKRRPI